MGYDSYIELAYYRMNRNCYDQEMVENFRRQVKESFVPFASKLHEQRRERLGLDSLKYYDNDMYFSAGNPAPTGTPEEILKSGQEMYHELSPETGEFFDFMMENELFDVLGRRTKKQGGYMTFLPNYRAPFIFANFNGTSGDVDVITHECGHAFQGYLTRNDEIREHNDLTMETAEIHSMSMEYFTYGWMDKFFGERADEYRTMHFADSAIFVPYGCMVDEFQHRVYANPELTPAERKAIWKQLEKEYRPEMDYEDDPFFAEGGYWQRQGHIFNSPFYYIDYVLASICAMQFKAAMDEDYEDAWNRYLMLSRSSASDYFTGTIAKAGLENPFEDGTISRLVAQLSKKVD
jgi:M3 family oligoendopeptidase